MTNQAPQINLPGTFPASFNLSELDGSNGFVLNGIDSDDISGFSVSGVGDVNGDGIDDIIVGAFRADPNGSSSGESYVVFGNNGGFSSEIELSDLDGSNGFVLNGIDNGDQSGFSVSGAGDVNGDGIDDIIIGAYRASPNASSSGESYVVFGNSGGFSSEIELSDLDGSNDFVLNGIGSRDRSGLSVSGAGDVNGDGIDDIIIGTPSADPNGTNSGQSYVVFGTSSGFSSEIELSDLDGSNGFVLNGVGNLDFSGESVSGAGDVNGDGIDDIIIGAANGSSSEESYVVFGISSGFSSEIELSDLDGSNGFILTGIDGDDTSGFSVSGAGDVNSDGIDDIIIGASSADPNDTDSGQSYVVFGNSGGFSSEIELLALDGSNGFVLNGIGRRDFSGNSVSGAGDVNGDGIDDIIIGATDADPNGSSSGETYVVFGNSGGFSSEIELLALDGSNGFVLNGIDRRDFSGNSVSGAGDVNGDGIDDIIIGAADADPNGSSSGETYVVFGAGANLSVPENTTPVVTIPATDVEGDILTYSISGGVDSSFFTINASTGALSFNNAPDFESPEDENGDNIYEVEIAVSDGNLSDARSLEVNVTDVVENQAPITNDFDRDNNPDVLIQNNSTGEVGLWLMNGTRIDEFEGVDILDGWTTRTTGDFNQDGNSDVMIQNNTTGEVGIWLMDQIRIDSFVGVDILTGWTVRGTGDFNDDNNLDVLIQNNTTGEVGVWFMDATRISGFAGIDVLNGWTVRGTGDFNDDSNTDVLIQNNTTGAVGVWFMDDARISDFADIDQLNGWTVRGVRDYTSDQNPDVMIQNNTTGEVGIWLMNDARIADFTTVDVLNGWTALA
ncbi:MAG: hypothetical protein AAGG02_16550 [Cyanobacteria bacterium P01_H01_bin.15]